MPSVSLADAGVGARAVCREELPVRALPLRVGPTRTVFSSRLSRPSKERTSTGANATAVGALTAPPRFGVTFPLLTARPPAVAIDYGGCHGICVASGCP